MSYCYCYHDRGTLLGTKGTSLLIPQSITYLYTGKCASPQQTAQHGSEPHNTGFMHPFVIYLYLIHFYFSLISFISKSIFLYMGKVNFFSMGDGGDRYLRPH